MRRTRCVSSSGGLFGCLVWQWSCAASVVVVERKKTSATERIPAPRRIESRMAGRITRRSVAALIVATAWVTASAAERSTVPPTVPAEGCAQNCLSVVTVLLCNGEPGPQVRPARRPCITTKQGGRGGDGVQPMHYSPCPCNAWDGQCRKRPVPPGTPLPCACDGRGRTDESRGGVGGVGAWAAVWWCCCAVGRVPGRSRWLESEVSEKARVFSAGGGGMDTNRPSPFPSSDRHQPVRYLVFSFLCAVLSVAVLSLLLSCFLS